MVMSLLRLPTDVRLAIYAFAGAPILSGRTHICADELETAMFMPDVSCPAYKCSLSTIHTIDLNHRGAEEEAGTPASSSHSRQQSTTLSLLLSCSTVYTELVRQLYSHSQILIRARDDASLAALSRLRVPAIHGLRRLTIALNATSCDLGWSCEDELDPFDAWKDESDPRDLEAARDREAARLLREWTTRKCHSGGSPGGRYDDCDRPDGRSLSLIREFSQSRPLTVANELHEAILHNWHRVWTGVRKHLRPATLELDFTCDVADVATGTLALRPFLLEEEPYLAKCNIRIARTKNAALRALADLAVRRVVCPPMLCDMSRRQDGRKSETPSITFMDLPAEIRQHILGYTDLVAPENEVEWSAYRGWYVRRGGAGVHETPPCRVHLHPIATDRSDTLGEASPYDRKTRGRWDCRERIGGRGCFCKSRHTVSSSYSGVSCWAPPTALFLINSLVRQDALQVFFGRNRIVVWPSESIDHAWEPGPSPPPTRLPISRFLDETLPQDALRHVRYLEVVFADPLHGDDLIQWTRTIEQLRPHLVSPNMALKIFFAAGEAPSLYELYYDHPPPKVVRDSPEDLLELRGSYANTIAPLRPLRDYLQHLWVCLYAEPEQRAEGDEWVDFSRELERTIMGPSYTSPTRGDYERKGLLSLPVFLRPGRWYTDHKCWGGC